jgi:hypothetical protein
MKTVAEGNSVKKSYLRKPYGRFADLAPLYDIEGSGSGNSSATGSTTGSGGGSSGSSGSSSGSSGSSSGNSTATGGSGSSGSGSVKFPLLLAY